MINKAGRNILKRRGEISQIKVFDLNLLKNQSNLLKNQSNYMNSKYKNMNYMPL